jgi:hypothetical protein
LLDLDEFLVTRKKEIVDLVEGKDKQGLKITGNIFDRLVNELATRMPFGPTFDKTHIVLSNAMISSLWCGWLSQAMANKKEPKFPPKYVVEFKQAIIRAFEIGQNYATERP